MDPEADMREVRRAIFVYLMTRLGRPPEPLPNVFFLSVLGKDPDAQLVESLQHDDELRAVFHSHMPSVNKGSEWDERKVFQGVQLFILETTWTTRDNENAVSAKGGWLIDGCGNGFDFRVVRRQDGWVVYEASVSVIY